MAGYVDICSCGHPEKRHELYQTEYARCNVRGCFCSGGVRVAVRVWETAEHPSVAESNARFFKRMFHVEDVAGRGNRHPLTDGLAKTLDLGISAGWVYDGCDRCGGESLEYVPYMAAESGEAQVVIRELSGRTILLCEICDTEVKYLATLAGEHVR